jgi:predicted nucleic-acid-binding protein
MSAEEALGNGAAALRGLDTNVLVRYFTLDDREQAALARDVVDGAEHRGERLFVSLPVLCELIWTLGGPRYGTRRDQLAQIVAGLLESPVFAVQQRAVVRQALEDFRTGRAGFGDYVIGRCAEAAGCSETLTFDRALAVSAGFRLLLPSPGTFTP